MNNDNRLYPYVSLTRQGNYTFVGLSKDKREKPNSGNSGRIMQLKFVGLELAGSSSG